MCFRREIFEKYSVTDENVRRFFDIAEIMYDKLAYLFPEDPTVRFDPPRPEVFSYNFIPHEWGSEPDLYEDYSETASRTNAWSTIRSRATFYGEGIISYLCDLDEGFPAIVGHEVGHLFTNATR